MRWIAVLSSHVTASELARRHGVIVCQVGEGADELFSTSAPRCEVDEIVTNYGLNLISINAPTPSSRVPTNTG